MSDVKTRIQASMPQNHVTNVVIDEALMRRAIQKLRLHKSDGESEFNSCHLVYGSSRFYCQLAQFYNALYIHSYLPDLFLNASIVSIPKDYRKSLTDESNYRGIALCSSLSKVLEIIMLLRNHDPCKTNPNQFAFKQHYSTSMCSYVLKEIVHHYLNNDSCIYACFLDATKAFDRVNFFQLFNILLIRGVCPADLRLLLFQYEHQRCRTKWKNSASEYFPIANGVRQGGVASPTLFCMYLDVLLDNLESSPYGCRIEQNCYNCLAYADDIVLLSPTLSGLQSMLLLCEEYCETSKLQFNPTKSACICFRKCKDLDIANVSLTGNELQWVDEVKHLGHVIMYNLSEKAEIVCKRSDLVCRTNVVLSNFCNMDHSVLLKIYMSQCAHIYGCQSWQLFDKNVHYYHTMFNRCLRRLLKLPYKTHTAILSALSNYPPASCLIARRMLKFIASISVLPNRIGSLAQKFLLDQSSIIAQNKTIANRNSAFQISDHHYATSQTIAELLYNPPIIFSSQEASLLANFLCEN
jgi:hypothetical protein